MSAPGKVQNIQGVLPGQVRFDVATLSFCLTNHKAGPVYPCPVCFLSMVHAQPVVDLAHNIVKAVVRDGGLDAERLAKMNEVLTRFEDSGKKLMQHVAHGGGVQ